MIIWQQQYSKFKYTELSNKNQQNTSDGWTDQNMNIRSQLYQNQKLKSMIGKHAHMASSQQHTDTNHDNIINSKVCKQKKLTGLYKYIGKANQLTKQIPMPLNILYSQLQKWDQNQKHSKVIVKNANQQQEVFQRKVRTLPRDRQLKNCSKGSKKINYGNFGYNPNTFKNISHQNFGKLVYDRFIGKIGNSWKINPHQAKGMSIMSDKLQVDKKKNQEFESQQENRISGYQKVNKDQQYQFDSKFQSGNLQKVYKQTKIDFEQQKTSKISAKYSLFLQNDTNTFGYNQWYYFKVRNILAYQTIELSIVNLRKNNSLHQKGMRISIFSKKKFQKYTSGWEKGGSNIEYYQNGLIDDYNNRFYTLSFQHTFEYANDDVYFAMAYPYTYQEMREDVYKLASQGLISFRKIGFSVMKNQIIMIMPKQANKQQDTFSNNDSKDLKKREKSQANPEISKLRNRGRKNSGLNNILIQKKLEKSSRTIDQMQTPRLKKEYNTFLSSKPKGQNSLILKKPFIFIMARVHPCETMSSFVMQGIIENLFSKASERIPECKYLLSKFNIRLIPMINPDGVIHGNSRTSAAGCDLNRRWKNPNPIVQPQVYSIKKYLESIKQQGNQIFSIIDLHGHSKKQGSFFYGACQSSKNFQDFHRIKLFNAIMGQMDDNFTREYSSFYVSQSKAGTARVTCSRSFTPFSYTLQSSYLGKRDSHYHFSVEDYKNIGKNILFSLAYFHQNLYPSISQLAPVLNQEIKQKILEQKQKIKMNITEEIQDDKSVGSSSNPSLFNFPEDIIYSHLIPNKFTTFSPSPRKQTRYGSIRIVQTSRRQSPDITNTIEKNNKIQRNYTIQKKKKAIIIDQLQLSIQKVNQPVYQLYNFKSRRIFPKKRSSAFPLIQDPNTQTSMQYEHKQKQ